MIEYYVVLKRHEGSARPDVVICSNENRDAAIREMKRYVDKNGFSVKDRDGTFTVAGVHLVEQEPIVGAPIISETPYHKIFDVYGNCIKRKDE